MKILIVTQYFWPESFRINDLALGLQGRGHKITVITGMPNYASGTLYDGYGWITPSNEDFHGIEVLRVPVITRGRNKSLRLATNYLTFALSASIAAPLRCRGQFDLIFVYQPSPVTTAIPALCMRAVRRKLPVIIWVQDLWPETVLAVSAIKSGFMLRMIGNLADYIYRSCDKILVQSRQFIPQLTARGINPVAIEYLPNWAEEFYRPLAATDASIDPIPGPRGFRILFAGNIGSAQSFETIIETAFRLRTYDDIHWVVIGDGNMHAWLKKETLKRGLAFNFQLLDRQPPEDMPLYFAYADALLVTLRADPVFSLTVPSKIPSYLACGRPLIGALDGEGARVIEEADAGIACPAQDAAALADAVMKIYRMSPAERQQLGDNGRAYFEAHFARGMCLDRLESTMKDLASKYHADTYIRR